MTVFSVCQVLHRTTSSVQETIETREQQAKSNEDRSVEYIIMAQLIPHLRAHKPLLAASPFWTSTRRQALPDCLEGYLFPALTGLFLFFPAFFLADEYKRARGLPGGGKVGEVDGDVHELPERHIGVASGMLAEDALLTSKDEGS
ncbi:hypothetical protein BJ138DRAFT_1126028 [Hygrophoropsis aurantiaca]|uniref:Uncharacterized protein n=1 Tax=Hygrophoropsis aurantiaca TaxID=72124 RepID=A0ACB8AFU8_9AGAM|nr:hypothetical protein BJ138DRAFT_1126028 [Hygrophoropsis aurantiaca]